ncbi:hypothetical protein GF380_04350 [Candidatus Uhrbacteria bacterium]|nr:hypothetical protein [Candidatus Uhrbacteria bacterium]MBD3284296.1 hypothetical protein [Candidatus Uhrbacteria bacterium]
MRKEVVRGMKLCELEGVDLQHWTVGRCYLLELEHGCMGTFPAIVADTGDPILVLERPHLEIAWDHLESRRAKVSDFYALICLAEPSCAFSLEGRELEQHRVVRVWKEQELRELCATEGAVEWAPGLLSFNRCHGKPDFSPAPSLAG